MRDLTEGELGRAASLVSEIVYLRENNQVSVEQGSSDEDLRDAVYALEDEIRSWRTSVAPSSTRDAETATSPRRGGCDTPA